MSRTAGFFSKAAKKYSFEGVASPGIPLSRLERENFASILNAVGDAEVVMIGEATHGTEEFYRLRAEITKRLIEEKGFSFVAVEGDWPDVYRVNRYAQMAEAKTESEDASAAEALRDFQRFPTWMWRNQVMVNFTEWLKEHNSDIQDPKKRVGVYGLDLYSMYTSAHEVIHYLDEIDPSAAKLARRRYGTLDQFKDEPHDYAAAVMLGISPSCEKAVVQMLVDICRKGPEYLSSKGMVDGEELFYAQENAVVVKDAEEYYRKAYAGGAVTWNLRDRHMHNTLKEILQHYNEKRGWPKPKAVVWAHNSHLGDARATSVSEMGEFNIGQLVRQTFGLNKSFNIGFSTYNGTVRAATKWGRPGEVMEINDARPESYEYLLHTAALRATQFAEDKKKPQKDKSRAEGEGEEEMECEGDEAEMDFAIILRSNSEEVPVDRNLVKMLKESRLERAIGVQYVKDPRKEIHAHYFDAVLPEQFDVVIHVDRTSALRALDD
jgi:erythromycin esterase-like protein